MYILFRFFRVTKVSRKFPPFLLFSTDTSPLILLQWLTLSLSFPLPPTISAMAARQSDTFREVWSARGAARLVLIRIDDDGKIDPVWWKSRPIWKL